jgi:hypothetical protein
VGIICSQLCNHPKYGLINIKVISTAKAIRARLRGDTIYITTPPIDYDRFINILDNMSYKLANMRAQVKPKYSWDFRFDAEEWFFRFCPNPDLKPGSISGEYRGKAPDGRYEYIIYANPDIDFSRHAVEKGIAEIVKRFAIHYMRVDVLPYAMLLAENLGVDDRITGMTFGTGRTRLGTCSRQGVIKLSYVLAFLPKECRRHTITHEFAHLFHFDHSPAFHAEWRRLFGADTAPITRARRTIPIPLP